MALIKRSTKGTSLTFDEMDGNFTHLGGDGSYQFPATDGTSNQILTTDGNGQLSFASDIDITGAVTINGSASGSAKFDTAVSTGGVGIDASSGSNTDTFIEFDAPDISATGGDVTYRFGRRTTEGSSGASSRIIMHAHDNTTTQVFSVDSSGTLKFDSGFGSSATAYGVRAWVKFNGTGTVAINGSGNVSSITDNNDGVYTVNFSTSLPDSNYAVSGFACNNDDNNTEGHMVTQNLGDTYSTSALKIRITELTALGGVFRDDVTKIAVMVVR
jgi:hypothetical protein